VEGEMGATRPGMQLRCCARRTGIESPYLARRKYKRPRMGGLSYFGGEGGIRTHGTGDRTPDFESGPFDHSGTPPMFKMVPVQNGTGFIFVRPPKCYPENKSGTFYTRKINPVPFIHCTFYTVNTLV
jgi:hypothetical protein